LADISKLASMIYFLNKEDRLRWSFLRVWFKQDFGLFRVLFKYDLGLFRVLFKHDLGFSGFC
jgi:hypothetical protein